MIQPIAWSKYELVCGRRRLTVLGCANNCGVGERNNAKMWMEEKKGQKKISHQG
jgi:hypothetical protein